MTEPSTWFESDEVLEREIRSNFRSRDPAPTLPGLSGLREIGRGGQGIVYSATQMSTRRRVAVKVLRDPAAGSEVARRRLEREVDVVASLRHPNLVPLHDVGIASDGRPYLVMELVEGEAIEHHPDVLAFVREPTIERMEALVRLFLPVCDAVNYAHQHGVIHRDLKPNNLRVDGDGQVRVLDFGLAKAFGESATPATAVTMSGQFVGSLPWASPEQAGGHADAVDVRTDVYGLGVVLYRLLAGAAPFDEDADLRLTLDRILNDPPVSPRRRVPEIDADLETIVMRALAKEPARRYQSAADLARDLRNWLTGAPIEARRDSTWYLLRTTARRHRVGLAAAAIVFVSVVVALIVALKSLSRATVEQARAEREAGASKAAFDFLVETLGSADPDRQGSEHRVIDAANSAASLVATRFADQPALAARLHDTLRQLFFKLGRADLALPEAEKALDLLTQIAGSEARTTLIADGDRVLLLHQLGRDAEAEPQFRNLFAIQRRVLGPADHSTLTTQHGLAMCLMALSHFDEAGKILEELAVTARPVLGEKDTLVLGVDETLAQVYRRRGDGDEAERRLRDVVARRGQFQGLDHSETLNASANLAELLAERGKVDEAATIQLGILEKSKKRFGADSEMTLTAAHNYGTSLHKLRRLAEAETMLRETLDARVRTLGEEHPHTLATISNLAALEGDLGHVDLAEQLNRRAYEIRKRKSGPQSLDTLISANNLATILRGVGRPAEAEEYNQVAVVGAEATLGKDHWISAVFRSTQAATFTALKRYAEAEPLLLGAADLLAKKLGPTHPHTRTARSALVKLYEAWGKPELAAPWRAEPESAPAKAAQ